MTRDTGNDKHRVPPLLARNIKESTIPEFNTENNTPYLVVTGIACLVAASCIEALANTLTTLEVRKIVYKDLGSEKG